MTEGERDPILARLSAADPTHEEDPAAEADMRQRVLRRASGRLTGDAERPRFAVRRVLLPVAVLAAAAAALAIVSFSGGDGLAPGPERALAIEKGRNGVTLTITDRDASAAKMNSELADAGIDRVRVISVPGSPNHAGTWGGSVDLSAYCDGAPTRHGFGVRIVNHPNSDLPAPGRDFVDVQLPVRGDVTANVGQQAGAGKRAIVDKSIDDDPKYAPAILVAIHPRSEDEPDSAKELTADDLIEMGGLFAPYGEAMADGRGTCEEMGLEPVPPAVFPPEAGDWALIKIDGSESGEAEMTETLREAGIHGRFKVVPVNRREAGSWLGWERRPGFGPKARPHDNVFDLITGDPQHPDSPSSKYLALRLRAFEDYPNHRWVFWVGRKARPGEPELVVGFDGPVNAAVALRARCKGIGSLVSMPSGEHFCASTPSIQIPAPE